MSGRSPSKRIRSSIPKLTDVAKVPGKVAGMTRRQQFSITTKKTLIRVAAELFAANGYAATSLDAIVSGAAVTKGALYHHFSGKLGVFEAVFDEIEANASYLIGQALKKTRDPWEQADVGLRAFLEIVQDPAYQRIVIQEGPVVLGYERFREQGNRSSFGLVHNIVTTVLASSQYELSEEMADTFSRIFYGALSSAGETVSSAVDPAQAVLRIEAAFTFILAGLRMLADAGMQLNDPEAFLALMRRSIDDDDAQDHSTTAGG